MSAPIYAFFFSSLLILNYGYWEISVIANLVGAFLFFPIDKLLFNKSMPITKQSFGWYTLRWQSGTPYYVFMFAILDNYISNYAHISIITNFIGGLIYYNIDKLIFSHPRKTFTIIGRDG